MTILSYRNLGNYQKVAMELGVIPDKLACESALVVNRGLAGFNYIQWYNRPPESWFRNNRNPEHTVLFVHDVVLDGKYVRFSRVFINLRRVRMHRMSGESIHRSLHLSNIDVGSFIHISVMYNSANVVDVDYNVGVR